MKNIKKLLVMAVAFTAACNFQLVKAASVAPGGTYNVSISCGGNEGAIGAYVENGTLLSINGEAFCNRGASVSFTAQAGSAGSSTVVMYAIDVTTATEQEVPANTPLGTGGVSVVVSGGASSSGNKNSNSTMPNPGDTEHSSDNNLKGLSVSTGELTPAFSADVTDYTVNLPADAKAITVNAEANDAKATVAGTGERALEAGDNVIEVAVTAENLAVKVYKINVVVDEKPSVYTTFGGKKLGVVRTIKNAPVPANFTETTVKIKGKEIPAWKNDAMKVTIVYLVDDKNNKQFYLFEDGKITSSFKHITVLGKEAFVVDIDKKTQEKTGMKYQKLKLDNQELMGWTFEDSSMKNYQIFYLMDLDGVCRYYQHETSQNTLQLYSGAAPTTQSNYAKQINDLKNGKTIFLIWASLATLLLVGGAGFVYYQNTKKRKES